MLSLTICFNVYAAIILFLIATIISSAAAWKLFKKLDKEVKLLQDVVVDMRQEVRVTYGMMKDVYLNKKRYEDDEKA